MGLQYLKCEQNFPFAGDHEWIRSNLVRNVNLDLTTERPIAQTFHDM